MRTAPLGAGGPAVTPLGLGLAALGRPAYINLGHGEDLGEERSEAALRERTHAVLDAAWAAGIRYFDAARSYGLAEEFLASWLAARGLGPGAATVGSKWGYRYTGGWRLDAEVHERKDLRVDTLRRQLEETRALLGEHLDLYQVHSATVESGVLEDAAVLGELAALRAAGVAIGLSVTGAGQGATIDRALETGAFDTVQATWNLLERSAEGALERAHAAGLGVIVKEGVANGRLAGRAAPAALAAAAAARGTTPDALALGIAASRPWTDVVLSGASSEAMLASNLQALAPGLDTSLDDRLEALREPPEAYWATRSALAWT